MLKPLSMMLNAADATICFCMSGKAVFYIAVWIATKKAAVRDPK